MRANLAAKEVTKSVTLPPQVPPQTILGRHGKIVKRLTELTGANIAYVSEDHRVDVFGRPKNVAAAAQLVERTVEHFQYSGMQFARKENFSLLSPELSQAPGLQLLRASRPINTLVGGVDGFFLAPLDADAAAECGLAPAFPDRSQQPGASTSGQDPASRPGASAAAARAPYKVTSPLLRDASEFDSALQQLLDLAVSVSLQHPAECDSVELRMYLGKLALVDVRSSMRLLAPGDLLGWSYPRSGKTVFETALPQSTIVSLDSYLTSRGLAATAQSKSASLHLETSVPWIQYHPTFKVDGAGKLRLAKMETLGCKPLTLAMVGPPDRTDVRMRYVAAVQHGEDDPVASELRNRESEFSLAANGVQIIIPNNLDALDLTLTSARVKLKRVYTTPGPLPPPPCAWPAAAAAPPPPPQAAAAAEGGRTRRRAAPPPPGLPPVSLKVSVAAVLDNVGARRLEVTVACPEVNATLMELHRSRAEAEGARAALAAQVGSLLAHVQHLREHVSFEP